MRTCRRGLGLGLLAMVAVFVVVCGAPSVEFHRGDERIAVDLTDLVSRTGTVAYQGPAIDGEPNWKSAHSYVGVSLQDIVDSAGGLGEGTTLGIVAADGWYKVLPRSVVVGESDAGLAILATVRDEESEWDGAPMLVFLPEDEAFSNEDMLAALGPERSHYFGDSPSTTGMMVKNVAYLVVDYDGSAILPDEDASEEPSGPTEGVVLTLVKGSWQVEYTLADLQELDTLTAPGTYTNSAGVDRTSTYTGVPLMTLLGNAPADGTVRVTAADGYSMNYAVEMLSDESAGTWVLAYQENGEWMPDDPGPLRIVQIGESNPHFTSALSARMVERIELQGTYEPYTLRVTGAVDRVFTREELEAGVGCPCHTATISVTSKGETHEYSGLPLWRLIGYVDDNVFPDAEKGIHYNDEDFNDTLAGTGYQITLVADDGYERTVPSDLIARDDRFVVAFKKDGVFLDPESNGYMRFVFDDSVELPDGVSLKSVKFLAEIHVDL